MSRSASTLALAVSLAAGACGSGGGSEPDVVCEVDTTYQPAIVPANFSTVIDNPLMPLVPGTTFTFQAPGETIVVQVTSSTRVLMGVTCVEVHDTATSGGVVIEDTRDWFAQDSAGNVWYFGEETAKYQNGVLVSTEGSWQAGVGGAQPGIAMLASPQPGDVYRQEYLACHAEDATEVVAVGETVALPAPFGTVNGCVRTRDYTPLDIMTNEYKWYCPGIGVVAAVDIWTGNREVLVSRTP